MADSQLFDVLLVDNLGRFADYAGQSLPFSGALSLSRGVNDNRRANQPTAIVVPNGSHDDFIEAKLQAEEKELQTCVEAYHQGCDIAGFGVEATSSDSNALDEHGDSDATDDTEDATEANVDDELYESVRSRRAKFVQSELRKQIKRIWSAVPLVTDGADLGIVAASLEVVSRAVDGVCEEDIIHERFAYGLHGDLRYHELEDALGVVRRDVHELKKKVLGL